MTGAGTRFESLFAYGTLRLEAVQLATFGRRLNGTRDLLPAYALAPHRIDDKAVIAVSGNAVHTMATFTGLDPDVIEGTVFSVTPDGIRNADAYEVPAVRRVAVLLRSGVRAWRHVDARCPPPEP